MLVDRVLTKLKKKYPEIVIEKIDILTNPTIAWKEGIRMIPALKTGEKCLSGILLSEDQINNFIDEARLNTLQAKNS